MPAREPSPRTAQRIPSLDGLRALSILLVMASHSGLQDRIPGVFGVTVFFFISGFLITTLLVGEYGRNGTIAVGARPSGAGCAAGPSVSRRPRSPTVLSSVRSSRSGAGSDRG